MKILTIRKCHLIEIAWKFPRRETNDANDDTGRKGTRAGSRKERLKLIDPLLRLFTKYPVPNRARANRHAARRVETDDCVARASMISAVSSDV